MTDKDILEIAKCCGMDSFTGRNDDDKESIYWECWEHQLIEFALIIHHKGQLEEIRRKKTGIGYVNDVLFVDEF